MTRPSSASSHAATTSPRRQVGLAVGVNEHLLDIENVLGGWVTETGCAAFRVAYHRLVGPCDLVIVGGTSTSLAQTFALGSWRRALGPSVPDGADVALLEEMSSPARLAARSALVIVSGDGAFTEAADRAHAVGVLVVVVDSRSSGMSRRLRTAADLYIPLDLPLQLAA